MSIATAERPTVNAATATGYAPVTFCIHHASLLAAIKDVEHAVSPDSTRQILNGILFHFDETGGFMVATDTHRLVKVPLDYLSVKYLPLKPCQGIYRVAGLKLLIQEAKYAEKHGGTQPSIISITVTPSPSGGTGDVTIENCSGKIEGDYPNWKRVMPDYSPVGQMTISNPAATYTALKDFISITRARQRAERSGTSKSTIRVFVEKDGGEFKVTLAMTENTFTAFDATYLRDMLYRVPKGEKVIVRDSGREMAQCQPILFMHGTTEEVIMPMDKDAK